MAMRKSNPAIAPALILAATVAVVGGGLAMSVSEERKMARAKARAKRKPTKVMPFLVGALTSDAITFMHEDDMDKVQASFHVGTHPSVEEWAVDSATWLVENINRGQSEIQIVIEDTDRAEELAAAFEAALGVLLTGTKTFTPTYHYLNRLGA